MSDANSDRERRPGRHSREAGSGTWTPIVTATGRGGRHQAPEPPPTSPLISGILDPGGQFSSRPSAARRAGAVPVALATPAAPEPPVRTRITLAPPVRDDDETRIYAAPPPDGLSTFDLGTVPASVTPPRSWRRAAWFATLSSGGVAVGLLMAGSYFVSQPAPDNVAIDGWTGIRGEQPEIRGDSPAVTTRPGTKSDAPTTLPSSPALRISDLAGASPVAPSTSVPASTTVTPSSSGTPTTTQQPQKPTPTPAERETRADAFYRFPPDAETMGDRSEIFLNEITENPERAHAQTGGELYAEGAESIAARYAHIAYFEIEHIYIDQKNRVTINTVVAVFTDGTSERQQRTLRFEDGDRITQD